jgi:DNA-binding NarL/FixJ family response regulator
MENATRVLIADDSRRTRNGLRALLITCPEVSVVGEAANGREALELVAERRPDVVVMDVCMPAIDGLVATHVIKKRWPTVRVVVLTMYGARRAEAVMAGADVFLVKGCPPERLLEAILKQ